MNGVELIATERTRQIEEEGWAAFHDDEHEHGQLAMAAASYALLPESRDHDEFGCPAVWPWEVQWWRPGDRIRELVKAGALIAAEIDRLQRMSA